MHPLTIASNSLADDGVSPAGLRQNTDLITDKTTNSYPENTEDEVAKSICTVISKVVSPPKLQFTC